MHSLASLVRPVLPRRSSPAHAGRVDVRGRRQAPARARGPAVRALWRADRGRSVLPRLLAACAGSPPRARRCGWKARRSRSSGAGSAANRPGRLAAALIVHELRGRRSRRSRRAAVHDRLLLRGGDPPAEIAVELGPAGGGAVCPAAAHARVRPQRGLDATARRSNVQRRIRRPRRPPPPGARGRRLHDGRHRRRVRPRAAPAGAQQVHVITFARTPLDRTLRARRQVADSV